MAEIDRDLLEALQISDEESTDDDEVPQDEAPRDEGQEEDDRGQPGLDPEQQVRVGNEGLRSAPRSEDEPIKNQEGVSHVDASHSKGYALGNRERSPVRPKGGPTDEEKGLEDPAARRRRVDPDQSGHQDDG